MKRTRASIKGSPIFDGNPAPLHDVRAILFAGVCHLFTRDHVPLEETADRALAEHQAFLGMALTQYLDHERLLVRYVHELLQFCHRST